MNRGDYLRYLRQNAGMTQQEVADKLDVHQSAIYKYEKNSVDIPSAKLEKLAEVYGVTPHEILNAGVTNIDYFKTMKLTIANVRRTTGIDDYDTLPTDLKNLLATVALEGMKAFYNALEE